MMRRQAQFSGPLGARRDADEDVDETPMRGEKDGEALGERLLDVARSFPLASFAAVLAAGYVLGRVLRR
jgi:hypothetical protein